MGGVTVAVVLVQWFAADSHRVEAWYVHGFGRWLAGALNALSRPLPFSLMEPLFLFAVGGAIAWLIRGVRALVRRPGERVWIALRLGGEAYTAACIVLLWFQLAWGLAYARPVVQTRQEWLPPGVNSAKVQAWELEELAEPLVERVNALYLEIHGVPDAFAPTSSPVPWADVDRAIDHGFIGAGDDLGLGPEFARSRGPAKSLLSSGLFTWFGVSGIYFPFTGEANVNTWPPQWQRPFTMAHEKAHQRFITSENEASFHGMLACIHSDDPFVQYSGSLYAQRQVLRALQRANPWAFVRIISQRLPGVQRDVNAAHGFWTGYDGPLSDLQTTMNDAYLRANRVRGGIRSYGLSLELIVLYARQNEWPSTVRDMGSPLEDR